MLSKRTYLFITSLKSRRIPLSWHISLLIQLRKSLENNVIYFTSQNTIHFKVLLRRKETQFQNWIIHLRKHTSMYFSNFLSAFFVFNFNGPVLGVSFSRKRSAKQQHPPKAGWSTAGIKEGPDSEISTPRSNNTGFIFWHPIFESRGAGGIWKKE